MCEHVNVCVYVYGYVCVYVSVYVHMSKSVYICVYVCVNVRRCVCVCVYVCALHTLMGWLRSVGSLKLQVSFAKEPYKRDYFLQKRPIILRSLLIVATPYKISYISTSHPNTGT